MASAISDLLEKLDTPFLLIGGHSLAFYGYPRNTLDIDFLVSVEFSEQWYSRLRTLGYVKIHEKDPFVQFSKSGDIPVDLMIVGTETWNKLIASSREFSIGEINFKVPAPEHLVALKLHSATSQFRTKAEQDWEDIRQLVLLQKLDPKDDAFRALILQYGGEDCLDRIESF